METKITRLSRAKINERKKQLRRLNEVEKSWRVIQRDYYPEVSYQVLNRFATDKKYVPAGVDILKALDLYASPNPYRQLPKWYKRTAEALEYFNTKRAQIKQMSNEAKRQRDNFLQ